jgi:YD repeat-containing protein
VPPPPLIFPFGGSTIAAVRACAAHIRAAADSLNLLFGFGLLSGGDKMAPRVARALVAGLVLAALPASPSHAVDVTYTYDALGRLTGVAYNCGASTSYTYDAAGNRTASGSASTCPPIAVNDPVSTAHNTPVTFDPRSNDSDPSGYALTITAVSTPGHGAAVISGGTSITYSPASGYSGGDSFTYTISNGHGGTATATVGVTVS